VSAGRANRNRSSRIVRVQRWWDTSTYLGDAALLFTVVTVGNSVMMLTGLDEPKIGSFAYVHLLGRLEIIASLVGAFHLGEGELISRREPRPPADRIDGLSGPTDPRRGFAGSAARGGLAFRRERREGSSDEVRHRRRDALHLVRDAVVVAPGHELLAPTLLRSQLLSQLHEAVHRGELTADAAMAELASVRALRLRLLGDAVLQRVARQVANQLGVAVDLPGRVHRPHEAAGRRADHLRRRRGEGSGSPGPRRGHRRSRGDHGPDELRRLWREPSDKEVLFTTVILEQIATSEAETRDRVCGRPSSPPRVRAPDDHGDAPSRRPVAVSVRHPIGYGDEFREAGTSVSLDVRAVEACVSERSVDRPLAEPYVVDGRAPASWTVVVGELERSSTYWVASLHPAGRPHVVPVLGVVDDEALHFAAGPGSQKIRNLDRDPAIAVATHGEAFDVVLEGTARRVDHGPSLTHLAGARTRPSTAGRSTSSTALSGARAHRAPARLLTTSTGSPRRGPSGSPQTAQPHQPDGSSSATPRASDGGGRHGGGCWGPGNGRRQGCRRVVQFFGELEHADTALVGDVVDGHGESPIEASAPGGVVPVTTRVTDLSPRPVRSLN
jgi:hypothetical protein